MIGTSKQDDYVLPNYSKAHQAALLYEIGEMERRCLRIAEKIASGLYVDDEEIKECDSLTSFVSTVSRG